MGCVMTTAQRVESGDGPKEELLALQKQGDEINFRQILGNKSKITNQSIAGVTSSEDINDFYEIEVDHILGTGSSGPVRICTNRGTKIQYALKTLCKLQLKHAQLEQLRVEIAVMTELDHPNILRLIEYFETDIEVYLVLELCHGGELLDHLHTQPNHQYDEVAACRLIYTMLSAVNHCHAKNIVHRDLKLENFLFDAKGDNPQLKLIDFGLSQYFKPDEILHRAVGTPYYMSPEVIAGNYTAKCDIWSIGVIAYMLLSGVPPFFGTDEKATIQAVREGKWRFFNSLFKAISPAAKAFISTCLNRQTNLRPSAAIALKHQWFNILKNFDIERMSLTVNCTRDNVLSTATIMPLSPSRLVVSSLTQHDVRESDSSSALYTDSDLCPSSCQLLARSACRPPLRTLETLCCDSLSIRP